MAVNRNNIIVNFALVEYYDEKRNLGLALCRALARVSYGMNVRQNKTVN
jgi:hypothetical protein